MRREHVIIGGDYADIGRAPIGQRAFVIAHSGIGVGLIATGQMRPHRSLICSLGYPGEIGLAGRFRAFDDALGDG